jgi:hypothetical protein
MKRSAILILPVLIAMSANMPSLAYALTPSQSAAAADKAKTENIARLKRLSNAKAGAEALAKSHSDSVLKEKLKVIATGSVQSEVRRRNGATLKAAIAQEKIAASAPVSVGHIPDKKPSDLVKNRRLSLSLARQRVQPRHALPTPAASHPTSRSK